jgi:hypothetical protein
MVARQCPEILFHFAQHIFADQDIRQLQGAGLFVPVAVAAVHHHDIPRLDFPLARYGRVDAASGKNHRNFQKLMPVQLHRLLCLFTEDDDNPARVIEKCFLPQSKNFRHGRIVLDIGDIVKARSRAFG